MSLLIRIKSFFSKLFFLMTLFITVGSCGKKVDSSLIVKMIPSETLVLEFNAFSCLQIVTGIRTSDGFVTPAIQGPLIQFNRMTLEWTKSTSKLFLNSAKIKFRGVGIKGGETVCDLTGELPSLFEAREANNSAIYSAGGFNTKGKITSNPDCRIVCSMPLESSEVTEISATGELTIKGSELTNEGTESEKYFRVRSRLIVSVRP